MRIPERESAAAQLVTEEQKPGLDLMSDVEQVRVGRQVARGVLPRCKRSEQAGLAGDSGRKGERAPQQGDPGDAGDEPGDAGLAAPPEEPRGRDEQQQEERGVQQGSSEPILSAGLPCPPVCAGRRGGRPWYHLPLANGLVT
jgi:hypothetical protein